MRGHRLIVMRVGAAVSYWRVVYPSASSDAVSVVTHVIVFVI